MKLGDVTLVYYVNRKSVTLTDFSNKIGLNKSHNNCCKNSNQI